MIFADLNDFGCFVERHFAHRSAALESAKLSQTVGDFIVQRMHEWGVRRIFGYPGDGINGVFGALNRAPDKITFVQARH